MIHIAKPGQDTTNALVVMMCGGVCTFDSKGEISQPDFDFVEPPGPWESYSHPTCPGCLAIHSAGPRPQRELARA